MVTTPPITQADIDEAEALLVHDWFSDDERALAAKAFAQVRTQARDAALEEAAKVAFDMATGRTKQRVWAGLALANLATAIRSLKTSTTNGEAA